MIPVPLFVILYTLGLLKNGIRSMRMILFGFAMACLALSHTYWFIFDFMYEGKELPFAANELGEWGLFLLLGAALSNGVKPRRLSFALEAILMFLFVLANVSLWIYWNGEWIQDLATGASLSYLLYALIRNMKYSERFSKPEWILLGLAAFTGTGLQALSVILPAPYSGSAESAGYVYLVIISLVLFVLTILSLRKAGKPDEKGSSGQNKTARPVCLSFASLMWCTFSMYMSAGICYVIELFGTSAALLLIFFSLRKEMLFVLKDEALSKQSDLIASSQSEEVGSL